MKPILMNTEMVRAILDDRKTVTRRVVKRNGYDDIIHNPKNNYAHNRNDGYWSIGYDARPIRGWPQGAVGVKAPYRPGDILYVRETWAYGCTFATERKLFYRADGESDDVYRWRPSIHMPREAARIWLRVTDVRVERLQTSFFEPICPIFAVQAEGIDIGDTCRECIENYGEPCCVDTVDEDGSDLYGGECGELDQSRGEFSNLWDSTIKPANRERYGWAANPWVWVIAFERCAKPKEAIDGSV